MLAVSWITLTLHLESIGTKGESKAFYETFMKYWFQVRELLNRKDNVSGVFRLEPKNTDQRDAAMLACANCSSFPQPTGRNEGRGKLTLIILKGENNSCFWERKAEKKMLDTRAFWS